MVELRKRPAPPPAAEPARKKSSTSKTAAPKKAKAAAAAEPAKTEPAKAEAAKTETKAATKSGPPSVGDSIDLSSFGGEIEDNDGKKVTLKKLVDDSKAGVVLFTYPKASTPGCTKQACLFRDAYAPLTATGLSIYGLSTDSPKANTTFKTKQNLPYPLLCDPSATLIKAIGMKKAPSGTTRGVFVVNKEGKVLAAEPGGPAPTVDAVKKVVETMGGQAEGGAVEKAEDRAAGEGNQEAANTAAEVADSAAGLDGTPKL